jgi:nitrite reductase (NADH) large subunit
MRTVKTCVGQEFCRFGLGDSTKLGVELETRLQGMESPAKMKLAVSGCPRNCAESYVKDVGIVAIEGGRWEIYIGGAAGAHVRKGDLLATVDDAETAKTPAGFSSTTARTPNGWSVHTPSCHGLDLTASRVWWSRTARARRTARRCRPGAR